VTLEAHADLLKQSDYIGWVVYVDGTPIHEHVPYFQSADSAGGSMYAQGLNSELLLPNRELGRNCLDWKMLPHHKIQRLELYFGREWSPPHRQPVIRLDRAGPDLRFIQYKKGSILINAGVSKEPHSLGEGQMRTGCTHYVIGYWDPIPNITEIITVGRAADPLKGTIPITREAVRGHPCWPRPQGFGLGPQIVQLQPDDVPLQPLVAADGTAMV
jgi:hypothetical protein